MDEFGKLGAETSDLQSQMHSDNDSAESIADSELEDGELRKMLASPLYGRNPKDCKTSRKPIAPGKLAAMTQEKGASTKRTQADHSRRETLTSSSSQEPGATWKLAAMLSGNEEPGNQKQEFFPKKLIIWEDLFLKAIKIMCLVRQDLNS